ncbi:hypothetical protein Pmar_PMAR003789 [Perkinsus marinus ATCC 50983]|uniref:Reverse transcriptase domain-containing protein n=1 Tax=Perkinsus marinus (strain ATCC 50983 / TXsc) TaxID=423536 RepID=C5KUD2_PERM5|nr:hypothetical protein Pmar_PMAR003789 [Perkinsus marinus ATCC 50983]EER11911.1 hypothetical protein Pmar_PMAR003789 [Perkinsus marinus ATCC 50983]|eukprot:XP_002780116.1 hypothetical protein Pmar_PMAR003789 [Perkinsus marinus ATCC 50983]
MTKNRQRSEQALERRARIKRTRRAVKRARVPAKITTTPSCQVTTLSAGHNEQTQLLPVNIDSTVHPADRRAVELYKVAITENRAKEAELVKGITDGSAMAECCEWGRLLGQADPASSCEAIVQLRQLFSESIARLKCEPAVAPLESWIRLSRDEQGLNGSIWTDIIPLVKSYASELRTKIRDLLKVTADEPMNCPIQVNLMKAMLEATATDPIIEEDTFVQRSVARNGGVPIGIEQEVEFSPLWPRWDAAKGSDDTELCHFAADSWRNYKSADCLHDKVMAYIKKEVDEGHMIQLANLPEGAVPSKIGAIEKPLKPGQEDADIRVIDDLRRSGVNSRVTKCHNTIKLPGVMTTALIAERIDTHWRGAYPNVEPDLVCIERDVCSAFRHLPIHESEVKYCINCIPSCSEKGQVGDVEMQYYAHSRLPFGLCTSPTLWVRTYTGSARLAKRIFCFAADAEGLQIYIDDEGYFTIRANALDRLLGLLLLDEVLGFITSYPKIRVSSTPRLLGYQWCLSDLSVSVPEDKKRCLAEGVNTLIESYDTDARVDIAILKTVTGRLAWLCHICKALRPCLKNLYATVAAADRLRTRYPHASRIPLAKEALPDLYIFREAIAAEENTPWVTTTSVPASFLLNYRLEDELPLGSNRVTVVISDACPAGIAGMAITDGRAYWFMMQLNTPKSSLVEKFVTPHYAERWSSRDIGPLELLASYCACLLAPNDRPTLVLCDNKGAVESINKLSSKSGRMNRIVRELSRVWRYGRGLRAFHLSSKSNWLVDALSRQPSIEAAREYMRGSTMTKVDMAMLLDSLPATSD